ncbi:hypothetical protein EZS27_009705 [termite gut metagenome]|uniref:O-antigen ligase-related domain-containing protein n=1 Tax=termite gut metagenome TaxID=433724 RepID=A0A5J4SA16_9ZZZZ
MAFIFIGLYAIYERFIGVNSLAEYEISLNYNKDKVIDTWGYENDERTVGGRVRSIFLHPIGAGVNFALVFSFISYIYINYKKLIKYNILIIVGMLFITFYSVWLTNSRGPLVFLFISIIPLINFRKKTFYLFILLCLLLFIFLFDYIHPYLDNFLSIFNSNIQAKVGGSNLDMRWEQLTAAIQLFKQNPWFGNGLKSHDYINDVNLVKNLLGMESVWFFLLVERGILGVISYIYLIVSMVKLGKKENKFMIISLVLALLFTNTVTSLPGFYIHLFYVFLFILVKLEMLVYSK